MSHGVMIGDWSLVLLIKCGAAVGANSFAKNGTGDREASTELPYRE
jgi:hypothetical protein